MNVVFLTAAENDLSDLYSYIKDDLKNEIAAINIATKILKQSKTLGNFPEIGVNLGRFDNRLSGYRYLLVDNYILIYKLTEEVRIIRILYARSDYLQLLMG